MKISDNIEDLIPYFHKVTCSCGSRIGQVHNEYCNVARCMECASIGNINRQAAWCEHDWQPDVWTGFWPGTLEAIEQDVWCYWGPDFGETGWVECTKNHPGARPDLNRVK